MKILCITYFFWHDLLTSFHNYFLMETWYRHKCHT